MKVTKMRNRREPRSGWVGRLARGRRLDSNPLRRPSDRAETLIMAGLLAGFLAGAPCAALAGGDLAQGLARHVQQTQLATERQVVATTTQAAPASVTSYGQVYASVKARWTAPDGTAVTGKVPVTLDTPAGTRQRLWVTFRGQVATPPLLDSQIGGLTALGQGTGVIAVIAALLLARMAARHELDRRRFAAWDADWQATDPRGSQRQ
jgi:hypothetical protein